MKFKEIFLQKKTVYFFCLMILSTILLYLNHFDNAFHFDDFHTISQNVYIRSLKNIPLFFTDGTSFSSLPSNQSYRPFVSLSLAIDYWFGNSYNVFFFHLSNFIFFLSQGILIFFFFLKILGKTQKHKLSFYIAAAGSLFYMIHPVIAETVNYIIARSDIQSTFFVLLAFVLYQYSSISKKYFLYLIPILIGTLAKPTSIMFAPLLFGYQFLFEEAIDWKKINVAFIKKTIVKTLPAFIFCVLLYLFQNIMTPQTFSTGSSNTYEYLITQPSVISYYFGSLFFPIHLSADTDWGTVKSIWSLQFLFGFIFICTLIYISFLSLKQKKLRPIGFGVFWFFITLAPTSSLLPLAEVMNDHRMFFPYVGLILSLSWAIGLFIIENQKKYTITLREISIAIAIIYCAYGFATIQRNIVWDSEESLWRDVTVKSPKNGRGLMNYGLTQMAKGNYPEAEECFLKALKFTPHYNVLYTNLGILNDALGKTKKAEEYFNKSVQYGANSHTSWFYFGRFMLNQKKYNKAISYLEKANNLSPSHIPTRNLLMETYLELEKWDKLSTTASKTLKIDSNNQKAKFYLISATNKKGKLQTEEMILDKSPNAKGYLDLSLKYYQKTYYLKCISVAQKALVINPKFAEAYNNICSAYSALNRFDKAIENCNKALNIKPDFQLAKNNLNDALSRKSNKEELLKKLPALQSEKKFIDLSHKSYIKKDYKTAILICNEGIRKFPKSIPLFNNLCASYNSIGHFNESIKIGEKGLKINPKNQLLRNNYNWAKSQLKN